MLLCVTSDEMKTNPRGKTTLLRFCSHCLFVFASYSTTWKYIKMEVQSLRLYLWEDRPTVAVPTYKVQYVILFMCNLLIPKADRLLTLYSYVRRVNLKLNHYWAEWRHYSHWCTGPFINYVRMILPIFEPPPLPPCKGTLDFSNRSPLFLRKIPFRFST